MINLVTKHTEIAKEKHLNGLYKKCQNKIYSSALPKYLESFFSTNLTEILIGSPNKLLDINTEYLKIVKGKRKNRFNSKIRSIFNYSQFTNKKYAYNAYNLADNLQISCCPNCNRQYTITINSKTIDGQLTRPDFDHYFPKSKLPILSLSFYNLIPSCKICNSTFKGSTVMDLEKHIHPYIDNITNDVSFDYIPSSHERNKCDKIIINYHDSINKQRIIETFKLLKIEETYNGHKFIVDQILALKSLLNDDYLSILSKNTYSGINLTPEEAYRIGFGVNYKDDELFEHPFSKLKKDILDKEEMLSIFNLSESTQA